MNRRPWKRLLWQFVLVCYVCNLVESSQSNCSLLLWSLPEGPQGILCCRNSSDLSSCAIQTPASHCGAHPKRTRLQDTQPTSEIVVSVLDRKALPIWVKDMAKEYGSIMTVYLKNTSAGTCDHGNCTYERATRRRLNQSHFNEVDIPNIGKCMCTFAHHVAAHFDELADFTIFSKTNILHPRIFKELLLAITHRIYVGMDHPWLRHRRRFLTTICDPRWEYLPIYDHLCPCGESHVTWNTAPLILPGMKEKIQGYPEVVLTHCRRETDEFVQYVRESLFARDGSVVQLPLVFEHFEEDIYLAHRDLLKSFSRKFWEDTQRSCETRGEAHAAAAAKWAYLVGIGSFNNYPAYLVSPGVRALTNYSSGMEVRDEHLEEWFSQQTQAADKCVAGGIKLFERKK